MTNVPIPPQLEQDPFGLCVPGLGRDPYRTPMQWTPGPNAGFSAPDTPKLWLPLADDHEEVNVERQLADPTSILNLYRRLLTYRKATPALQWGDYRPLDDVPEVCQFVKSNRPCYNFPHTTGTRNIMLNIALIREQPEQVEDALRSLNADPTQVDTILTLDMRRRELLTEVEALRAERNRASKEIGRLRDQDKREQLIAEMRAVRDRINTLDEELRQVESDLETAMLAVPNLPHPSVPVGPDETHNVVVREWGQPREFDFEPVPHWDLGPELGIIDFERGVKLSGSRFYVLRGAGARLQRALIAWMLDVHTREHGYTEIYPPFVVKEECMWGAGQMPKFADNIYHDVEDDFWFIGTAEIPLTNLHRDEILDADELPLCYVAYSACFRREKMSAGRDVRGIKRGHQFDKVEMYKFTIPETSYDELEAVIEDALEICRRLGIPHRLVRFCTGDLGFTAAETYDIEMWAPGCGEWLEVSSVSNCEAFQARRANIRYRPEPGAKPRFVHTLNGSGLALPRVMISIIENYQQADGSVVVPEVLRPWMGGIEVIGQ